MNWNTDLDGQKCIPLGLPTKQNNVTYLWIFWKHLYIFFTFFINLWDSQKCIVLNFKLNVGYCSHKFQCKNKNCFSHSPIKWLQEDFLVSATHLSIFEASLKQISVLISNSIHWLRRLKKWSKITNHSE